ncbi:MAG: GHKL domain-containing protein [Alphaproteobacteria bacterium]|nr:MAG: GHKL domain-containing protein [Alphaproteobacteria bacterium]
MERSDTADTWLDLPPTPGQTRCALAVAAVVLAGFAAVVPIAGRPLAELNAFFPSLDAIVLVSDLITAVLLYAQFSISRSRALLALATGYLFTALIVIPHALTFAGAFSPAGLLGANIQTGSWLFIFWHIGFSAALLVYAALKEEWLVAPASRARALPAIGWCVAGVAGLVCALTWLATAGATLLPPIILDQRRISPIVVYPISFAMLISLAALLLLLRRRRSLLDLWLVVVALVTILELAFSGLLPSIRFSAGFYAGRAFSLLTASIVLIVMLAETTRLYIWLAHSNASLRREQNNKLMNLQTMALSIAHEVRQPLTAIAFSGAATLNFLKRSPPDLHHAEAAVKGMVDASQRANEVLDGVRGLFAKGEPHKVPVDVNDLIAEAVRSLQPELAGHKVETRLSLNSGLPPVSGHRGQLREVIVNLINNGLEAMASADGRRVLNIRTEPTAGGAAIAVEDTGLGVSPENAEGIFDAFVSTKPNGMGLGLAICRMIVERHKGELSFSAAIPRGAIFRVVLPQS